MSLCLCAQKRAVCLRVPCTALFEFTFTNGCTNSGTVQLNFTMTGLLSVFSLLPVQALKTREDSREDTEEEEEPGRLELKHEDGSKRSSQDGRESQTDTER